MPSLSSQKSSSMDKGSRAAELSMRLASIRKDFLDRLVERRARIAALVNDIDQTAPTPEAAEGIRHNAHKIAGVAATLGFPRLGELAAALDASLVAHADQIDWEPTRDLTNELLAEIEVVLNAETAK
ncbi:Hpt domain-containing protein [Marivita hallyeonensis]|uniref:Hpt domain-containing protein n=1 Tax=Marivita hallyeonensis TaxID=996342 RepID=A0A1M5MR33_9RHOB|nr:Hpt domain-containing protein [Marivita hallyeonensis]SHG79667.1 Hpt domain-containing protein [Marivita hallyeonensis]